MTLKQGKIGFALSMALLSATACQHRPATPQIEPYLIVIPKECVTSDVECTFTKGSKKMDCKFEKFAKCEHIQPITKESTK